MVDVQSGEVVREEVVREMHTYSTAQNPNAAGPLHGTAAPAAWRRSCDWACSNSVESINHLHRARDRCSVRIRNTTEPIRGRASRATRRHALCRKRRWPSPSTQSAR